MIHKDARMAAPAGPKSNTLIAGTRTAASHPADIWLRAGATQA
jgi:hypothetical protein